VLADSGVVDTDVVVTQPEAGDEAGGGKLHLCRYADEVRRVDTRLTTFLGAITVADFAQSLSTQRHCVGEMHERPTSVRSSAPHTCQHVQRQH